MPEGEHPQPGQQRSFANWLTIRRLAVSNELHKDEMLLSSGAGREAVFRNIYYWNVSVYTLLNFSTTALLHSSTPPLQRCTPDK
jgi:hypothetical protein